MPFCRTNNPHWFFTAGSIWLIYHVTEGDQTNIIQASPPDTGTQSQIAPAPHVPAGTAPAVDVLDGPDSTMKIVQKKKGRLTLLASFVHLHFINDRVHV